MSEAGVAQALLERRTIAAQATLGASSDAIYRAALRAAQTLHLTGRVLEFGAGTGTFIQRLSAEGPVGILTGADLLPRPQRLPDSVNWIQADLNLPLPCGDESFDAIVSTEVIEHLENPRAVFREFSRLLRPGGYLLLTTPNQESIRSLAALIVRGHHVAFLDESYPAHLTALLRRDMERLCKEADFEPPRFSYTNDGAVPRVTALRWQTISFGLLRGRLFSDNVVVVTRRLPRRADPCA
ncbi:MAG TPA: methyltransferase domain-containing protein [Vicinamibacterales bacterium]|nr:methyltransferase domain-containing protein [Vicinamibacterales bacterium]